MPSHSVGTQDVPCFSSKSTFFTILLYVTRRKNFFSFSHLFICFVTLCLQKSFVILLESFIPLYTYSQNYLSKGWKICKKNFFKNTFCICIFLNQNNTTLICVKVVSASTEKSCRKRVICNKLLWLSNEFLSSTDRCDSSLVIF